MPFHPTHTFQKNRRFWMAAILMICMVSFVFCTGMKGDMAERLTYIFGHKGTPIATVNGHNITSQQLQDLKMQRSVANEYMRNCVELGFKKVSKLFFEEKRKEDGKDAKARQQFLVELFRIRSTLYERKTKPRYFDLGVKFDDLLEFKLWQGVADKMGIYLDEEHVNSLWRMELYSNYQNPGNNLLSEQDFIRSLMEVKRNYQNVDEKYLYRALAEEYRVRIAQEAVLTSQPFRWFASRGQEPGFTMRFINPEMPNEIRAPLTLAQLWDAYKKDRSDFTVALVPVPVDDYLKEIKEEPTDEQKRDYFQKYRDKAADPSADEIGLTLPMRVKIEYVTADPTSKEYLGVAKTVAVLKTADPINAQVVQSPLGAAVTAFALAQKHRMDILDQYAQVPAPTDAFDYRSAPFSAGDGAAPIMTWLAKRHPEAAASMIGNGFAGPADDLAALAGYMAWGALKNPHALQASLKEEADRRAPGYAALIANGLADPLAAATSYLLLDAQLGYRYPRLPLDAVMHELEEQVATRAAEQAVQQNMETLRTELEKVNGDDQKYRRILSKLVPELNLTYGPAKKDVYYSRYSVEDAKELAPLRESFDKYVNLLNFFEARDVTPERLLKPGDFYKMFFDPSESFAATSPYTAMPWPPKAKTSTTRIWKGADPRLIDPNQLRQKDLANFEQQMGQADPLKAAPELDLFKDAEKPILFWRTGERVPERPTDYADIDRNLKKYQAEEVKLGEAATKMEELSVKLIDLRRKQVELKNANGKAADIEKITADMGARAAELRKLEKEYQGNADIVRARQVNFKQKEADLREINQLLVKGWRFQRARSEKALPAAERIAQEFLNNVAKTKLEIAADESARLHQAPIFLSGLAPLVPMEIADKSIDYFKPPLPKDKISYARDDMMDQIVQLYNLKDPIKTDNKALDDINKVLFDKVQQRPKNREGEYVQIFTNKPRSVFYVGVVTQLPRYDRPDFVRAIKGAYNAMEERDPFAQRDVPRNHFAQRIQQQDAKAFRADVISYLGSVIGYEVLDKDARKQFDERGAD